MTVLLTDFLQGFDEFMNLVIDDAVEIKQPTKTEGETRRELGMEVISNIPVTPGHSYHALRFALNIKYQVA